MAETTSRTVIEVHDLHKSYGAVKAVDGISFSVCEQEIFGILGPNGAGKTTTLEMIEGLRKPDSGRVELLSVDVVAHPQQAKQRIGVQLQSAAFPDRLTCRETLALFASFFRRRADVDALLSMLELDEKRDAFAQSLSGGQRQRLSIALAMVNDPDVIFLDEPTTGLDPQARRLLWDIIERIRARGKTIVLTTHYMEEAERLCDRVALMDHAKLVALDTPAGLVRSLGSAAAIEFTAGDSLDLTSLQALPYVQEVKHNNEHHVIYTRMPQETLLRLVSLLDEHKVNPEDLVVRRATLEDVFIAYTGRRLRE